MRGDSGGVGLLSIDAEGMDFEILQGLDFTRCRPKLVAVEVDPESALATQELMRSAGYRSRARLFNTEIWISGEP
jgi:hypothetical protein